jgi:hypothetical protein
MALHRDITNSNRQSVFLYDNSGDWKSPQPRANYQRALPSMGNADPRLTSSGDRPAGRIPQYVPTAYQDPSILYRLMPQ